MLGYLLFGGLFLLSFLGFVSRIQAALLFNVKFAKSLKRGRLLVRTGLRHRLGPAQCCKRELSQSDLLSPASDSTLECLMLHIVVTGPLV
jgi:hypothetical protein